MQGPGQLPEEFRQLANDLLVHGPRGQLSGDDLWVSGQEVTEFRFRRRPPSFAIVRAEAHIGSMSARCPRTANARGGLRIPPKTASDLHKHFVAGAGFEPATSGL